MGVRLRGISSVVERALSLCEVAGSKPAFSINNIGVTFKARRVRYHALARRWQPLNGNLVRFQAKLRGARLWGVRLWEYG